MHKNTTKCNETLSKWCKNNHGASKIIDMLETYHVVGGVVVIVVGVVLAVVAVYGAMADLVADLAHRSWCTVLRPTAALALTTIAATLRWSATSTIAATLTTPAATKVAPSSALRAPSIGVADTSILHHYFIS
jgi:uncharacterized membrane protein